MGKLIKTLSGAAFSETTLPNATFVFAEKNLVAVDCSVYTQWSGRDVSVRVSSILLLYDTRSLSLIASIENMDYNINDVSFHPKEDVLAIGLGSYDGGAIFSGELLLWNYASGHRQSVLKESRDVKKCVFENEGAVIRFSLSPETDFEETDLTEYCITYPVREVVSLQDLTMIRQYEDDYIFNSTQVFRDRAAVTLSEMAELHQSRYSIRYSVWDLVFVDEDTLVSGRNDATLDIWNLKDGGVKEVKLAEQGVVVEICKSPVYKKLLVNVWHRDLEELHTNILYAVDLSYYSFTELYKCNHSISQSLDGYVLARQIDHSRKTVKDFILNANYLKIGETRLGHYDLFNHYLRLNDGEALYYLAGNPSDSYKNKILYAIDTNDLSIKKIWQTERYSEHFNDCSGTLVGNSIIVNRKVYEAPQKAYGTWELLCLDLTTRKVKWVKDISCQASSMVELYDDMVIIALVNGQIMLVEEVSGDVKAVIREKSPSFRIPLSVAVYGNRMAVGLVNGDIELHDL